MWIFLPTSPTAGECSKYKINRIVSNVKYVLQLAAPSLPSLEMTLWLLPLIHD